MNRISKSLLPALVVIFLLGGALRIVGMTWGLPYQLHPDEPVLFINAWERWDTGTGLIQNDYPPLYIYVLVIQREFIYRLFGADTPQVIYFFFARWNSILISLLLLAVAYRVGKKAGGWQVGLALMLFNAVEPISALDQGWIIKADVLAWLFALLTLWASLHALQHRSWRWLLGAILLGGVATAAKYNMLFILSLPLYVALRMRLKRDALTFFVAVGGLLVITFAGWGIIKLAWVDTIEPRIRFCAANIVENEVLEGKKTSDLKQTLVCPPVEAFERFLSPFYQRPNFIDASTSGILEHIWGELRLDFGIGRLALITGLLVWLIMRPSDQHQTQTAWMLGALIVPTVILFSLFGFEYPMRQSYLIVMGIGIWLALGLGNVGKQQPKIYALLLAIIMLPYIWNGIEFRRELLKPDTRAATADYFLHHTRRGEAIVVEYDHVEFTQQYGGFPQSDGYFKIIPTAGIYDLDPERFFEQGIYYVVADWRSSYTASSYYHHQNDLPQNFEPMLYLRGDDYGGPQRLILRTFHPQHSLKASFDQTALLDGYDLELDGETLRLQLYWQSLADHLPNYSVFVHIFADITGEAVIKRDAPPARSTDQWERYEWIFDEREIPLTELAGGTYTIEIGIYDPITGARLPVNGDPIGVLDLGSFSLP